MSREPKCSAEPSRLQDVTAPILRETWLLDARTDPDAAAKYRSASAQLWDVDLHGEEAAFWNRLEGYNLGGGLFARCEGVAQTFRRTRAHVARDPGDNIQILLCLTPAAFTGDYDGRASHHSLGSVRLIDMLRPFEAHMDAYETLNLLLPRQALGGAGALDFHGMTLSENVAGGRLLAESLRTLWETIDTLSVTEADGAARAIGALAAGVIRNRAEPATGDLPGLVLAQARREIDARLADPDLTAARLTQLVAIGRSTAYRLFEPHGGVAAFIQARRLDRAFDALLTNPDVSLAEVGYRHGFKSASHFSRAFAARFGVPPSSARKAGVRNAPPSAAEDPAAVFDWIRRL